MVKATLNLLERPVPPDYLLVEASGVAEPGALAISFNALQRFVALDSIVTVVDAEYVQTLKGHQWLLARDQIRVADFLVINKIDLISFGF